MEKKFIITEGLLKALLEYLSAQPFRNVAQLIQVLSQLPSAPEEKAPQSPKQDA